MGIILSKAVFCPPSSSYQIDYKSYTTIPSDHGYNIPMCCIFHKKPTCAIIYSHGNAEDLGSVHRWCEALSLRFQASVFSYDYRGYGPIKGYRPSEKNVFSVVLSVCEYVKQFYREDQIIFFGRSQGCAPSIKAASVYKHARGLILESPFLTCIKTVINTKFTFWFDMFRNETNIKKCFLPTLVIHGKQDTVVPFDHGQQIFKECPNPWGSLWVEGAGHNDIDSIHQQLLFSKLSHFLYSLNPTSLYAPKGLRKRK